MVMMRKVQLFAAPNQIPIITARERNLGLFAGRRWGKTKTVTLRILRRCLEQPRFPYCYVTPGYSQCKEVYEEMINVPYHNRLYNRWHLQPFPKIYLKNGSEVSFRSFERPEKLRGPGFGEVWVDEIQNVAEKLFWQIIAPLTADQRGTIGVSGQFRGKNWYYKQFFLRGQPGTPEYSPLYRSWIQPTSTGLMFSGADGAAELEHIKGITPRVIWEQEYDCIPSASIARVFPDSDLQRISRPGLLRALYAGEAPSSDGTDARRLEGHVYIAGLDLGRVVTHPAMVVFDVTAGAVVFAERWDLGRLHADYAMRAGQIARGFRCPVVVDTTAGATGGHAHPDEYVRFYRKEIPDMHSFFWGPKNKEAIIAHLALAIQNAEFAIDPTHADLVEELEHYEYESKSGGAYYAYHAETGYHDDIVSALAQCVWGVKSGWAPTQRRPTGLSLAF
jgi:hypothetical protein